MSPPTVRRLLRPAILTAVLAVLAAAAVPAGASAACRGADDPVTPATLSQARHAVLCLHNAVRRAHHLPTLRIDRRLDAAATRHAHSMIRGRYFGHISPRGSTLLLRVRASGYLHRVLGYALGENLGWGEGRLSTPRAMVAAWMRSPGHRHNILTRGYRDVGIGIAAGTPVGAPGATYATDFGARR